MTHEERERLIQENKDAKFRTLADLSQRRELRELRGEMFDESVIRSEPTIPEQPPVMNAAQRQVRNMYEQNRPTLDPATQALWDAWFDRRFRELSQPRLKSLVENVSGAIGKATGKHLRQLRDEILAKFVEMQKQHEAEISKLKRDFNSKLAKIKADAALQKGHSTGKVVDLPNPLSNSVVVRR